MEKETDLFWSTKKLFSYTDQTTGVVFDVVLGSGITIEDHVKHKNTRASFIIRDNRIAHGSRVKIDLEYFDLYSTCESIKKLFKNGERAAFKTGGHFTITRHHTHNIKKYLTIGIVNNTDNKGVVMKLKDPSTTMGESSVLFNSIGWRSFRKFLEDLINNYTSVSMTFDNTILISELSSHIRTAMSQKMGTLVTSLNNSVNTVISHDDKNAVVEVEDEVVEENEQEDPDVANFMDDISKGSFEDIDLDIKENKYIETTEKIPQKFVGDFLDWDILKLKEWTSAITCLTENSKTDLFFPFELIHSDIKRSQSYYLANYGIIYYLKKVLKDNLQNNASDYPGVVPSFNFDKYLNEMDLDEVGKGVIVTILLYSIIINGIFASIDNIDKQIVEDYKRVYFCMKLIFSPYIFSINLEDRQKTTDELVLEFEKYKENGFLKNVEKDYAQMTMGGKFDITSSRFRQSLNGFLTYCENEQMTISSLSNLEGVKTTLNRFNVPLPAGEVTEDNIKKIIFSTLGGKKKDVPKQVNTVVVQQVHSVENDKKLELFIECISKYIDDETKEILTNQCNSFSDIPDTLRKTDAPSQVFKMKRIMDLHPNLESKFEILNKAKLLNEDENVTEGRVLKDQEEEEVEDLNYNVEDIIF